jgi:hypothetical protein
MKPGNDLGRAGLLSAWYKIDSFISSASYSASFPIVRLSQTNLHGNDPEVV